MKKDSVVITVLFVLCFLLLGINVFLAFKISSVKSENDSNNKNENENENIFYQCELEAGDEVFRYKYRDDIYFDPDGTLTMHKSGTSRVVETDEEIEVLINEANMFDHHYEMLGERSIFLYDFLDIKADGFDVWYEDVISGLKTNGYECKKFKIEK